VSYNGAIGQPPYPKSAPNKIYNITLFLASYDTRLNLTISNGTASAGNASLGDILAQEPGSTVKHVNWLWPDCLVGNGAPKNGSSARGSYNVLYPPFALWVGCGADVLAKQISMHQFFRLNGSDYHTIFDLPIQVTNEISALRSRPTCDSLSNKLLPAEQGNATGPRAVLPYAVPKEGLKGFAAGLARADVRVVAVVAGVIAFVVLM
jgi:hypothetical protein